MAGWLIKVTGVLRPTGAVDALYAAAFLDQDKAAEAVAKSAGEGARIEVLRPLFDYELERLRLRPEQVKQLP